MTHWQQGQGILTDWDLTNRDRASRGESSQPMQGMRSLYRMQFLISLCVLYEGNVAFYVKRSPQFPGSLNNTPFKPEHRVQDIIVTTFDESTYKTFIDLYTGGSEKSCMILFRNQLSVLELTDNAPLTIRAATLPGSQFNSTIFPLDTDKFASHDYLLELSLTALAASDAGSGEAC
ncbi:unnamed protein product [Cyclocybe aegerita]|uniref:Uncharacterized protein n=1 Tax=Cyclocybe aegerita TaxID=1973307 RepID=A0A8S0W3S7_CYCAE|nr:unnamed protein product [Cyclocybe aegerita]